MQLFAGELTNQNREYYKVNDNNFYATKIFHDDVDHALTVPHYSHVCSFFSEYFQIT